MKVKKLIEQLERLGPNAEIIGSTSYGVSSGRNSTDLELFIESDGNFIVLKSELLETKATVITAPPIAPDPNTTSFKENL